MIRRAAMFVAGLATVLAATAAPAQFGLGRLIDSAKTAKKVGDGLRSISEQEEIKIGGDLAATLLGAAPLSDDQAVQAYVNRVGRWLAMHSERPDLPWKFAVVNTSDVNAFSTPGGYVLISSGLFDRLRSESELAGVLAHEIAHVARRHHIHALQNSMRSSALGGMSDYFNSGGGMLGSQFSKLLINAGKEMFIRGLDKDDEFEADRVGVVIAARSGYSPWGLVGVLQTLSAGAEERGFALMTKTHPLPIDRIARLDTAIGPQFDALPALADDLPSFVALRNPPPAPAPSAKAPIRKSPNRSAPRPKPRSRR